MVVEPDNPAAMAEAIVYLCRGPDPPLSPVPKAFGTSNSFEVNRVTARFLVAIAKVAPVFRLDERKVNECAIGPAKT